MKYRLGDVCDLIKGTTGIKKAIPGTYPLVTLGENRGTHNEFQFDSKAVIVPLISSTGHGHASMKRVHYQEGKFALGSILCAVIPKDEKILSAKYLHIYLNLFKDSLLVRLMKGAANVSLPIKKLADVFISVPEFKKQIEIVELVEEVSNSINQYDFLLKNQLKEILKLRQQILQDAIQGKLVPQDQNDEPASVLVEKIKGEKEKLIKEKKLKKSKPLSPIKDEEIPFDIPKNWDWCRLDDISINHDESRIPVSKEERNRKEKIYDYYGASGVIDKIDGYTHEGEFLLIGEDGANLKAKSTPIAFIAKGKFWVNNHAHVLEFFNKTLLDYMVICLNIIDINSFITGGFQPKLSQGNLNLITIPIPPLAEQKRIVKKVEDLLKVCDELEKEAKQNQNLTQQLLQSALKEALEPKVN